MDIKYKETYSTKEKTSALSSIVLASAYDYDGGAVESANVKARISI